MFLFGVLSVIGVAVVVCMAVADVKAGRRGQKLRDPAAIANMTREGRRDARANKTLSGMMTDQSWTDFSRRGRRDGR